MKVFKQILITILSIIIIILFIWGYGVTFAVSFISLNHEVYRDDLINEQLDGMQIAFISDLHYGEQLTLIELEHMIQKINDANVDLILFGGDFFARPLSESEYEAFVTVMKQLHASGAMYGVYGDQDLLYQEQVDQLYFDLNIELLDNDVRKIYSEQAGMLYLVGINSNHVNEPLLQALYEGIPNNQFSLSFFHNPTIANSKIVQNSPLLLAGHTLGGQIYYPILSHFEERFMNVPYINGTHQIQDTTLHVSSGVGTLGRKQRLFTQSEVLIYTLKK